MACGGDGVVPARAPRGEEAAFVSASPPVLAPSPVAAAAAGDRRGFCSVRRFTGESNAAAAVEEAENGLVAGGDQVCRQHTCLTVLHPFLVCHCSYECSE
jgi:hypothetical protein